MQKSGSPSRIVVGHLHMCFPGLLLTYLSPENQMFRETLSTTLSNALQTILEHTSSEKGRAAVPPITNSSGISPFPVKLSVKVAGVEVG